MAEQFENVAILGGGLLGGSLALALESQPRLEARLWARRKETADEARAMGISRVTTSLPDAVGAADLVILAVPVGVMPDLVKQAVSSGMQQGAVVTDVGSVKLAPHLALGPVLRNHGSVFIGSHPMAGSEQNGIGAADASIFQGAACLLTNDEQADHEIATRLEAFWISLGCRTSWMGAAEHDALVARISHLPHLIAAAAALVSLQNQEDGEFGGGGLRDTTRVASGNPEMWAEIVCENRKALLEPLRDTIRELQTVLELLNHGDQEAARHWLQSAKHRRDALRQRC